MLSTTDLQRYSRHLALPDFSPEKQEKLKQARVLVVGAGGLGCPALLYLTASGIGTIGIADGDTVSLSNLQRQVLFDENDIGKNKANTACEKMKKLNSSATFVSHSFNLTSQNALEIISSYEIVLDGSDNFPTRYLINDACVLASKPLAYGSVFRYEGQVSVFNYKGSPNYRDLYPVPPDPGTVPDCEEGGVLGVLPGIIGTLQASEVIKLITGLGDPLSGKLLLFDSLTCETQIIPIPDQGAGNKIKGLIDYDEFCGVNKNKSKSLGMKEATVQELKQLIDSKADFQLIDCREPHEFDFCNLEGELIPMGEIPEAVEKISKTKKVIIHCRSGSRSGKIIEWLEKTHGFTNLYNLKGGILAWSKEIDPSVPAY